MDEFNTDDSLIMIMALASIRLVHTPITAYICLHMPAIAWSGTLQVFQVLHVSLTENI